MEFFDENELYESGIEGYFHYTIGDTILFKKDGRVGMGHIQDRRFVDVNNIITIYYFINDILSEDVMIEQDQIIDNREILLLELYKPFIIGHSDYI